MRRIFIVTLVLFGVLAGGLYLRHNKQVSAQKTQFLRTQAWLQDTTKKVTSTHPSTDYSSEAFCQRKNRKFEKGRRLCYTNASFVIDIQQKNVEEVLSSINGLVSSLAKTPLTQIGALDNRINSYSFKYNSINCSVAYYNVGGEPQLIKFELACFGPAMADYFPSRD